MKRRAMLAAPVLCAALACGGAGGGVAPNVVLISIDCLNQRQLETALENGTMPAVHRLLRQSRVFSRAYAHAPWTTPSHMSMLTGLYPSQHGHDTPYRFMIEQAGSPDRAPAYTTLAELLASAGYRTAGFVGQGVTSAKFGLGRGFSLFEEIPKNERGSDLESTVPRFLEWLQGAEAPFFVFLHTYDLHKPRPSGLGGTAGVLEFIDDHLGAILDGLAERGLYEDSLILLTGDHGSEMLRTERQCCVHGAGHYEENLKVPLAIRLPGGARPAGESSPLARHVDLLPTILDVTGVEFPEYAGPGVSLLEEPAAAASWLSFSEADARCFRRFALVTDRYKYIYTPRDTAQRLLQESPLFRDNLCRKQGCREMPPVEELFDLEADPRERHNLVAGGELGEGELAVLRRLREEVERHLNLERFYNRSVRLPDLEAAGHAIDPELERSLRALGYLD